MAPGANEPEHEHRRTRLVGKLRATARELIPENEEPELVAHHQSEELMEESGREPTELGNRESALLGYIQSRES